MENEWVMIAEYSDDIKCQVAVARLHAIGIDAVTIDKRDSIYRIGAIGLFVHRDHVLVARETIKDL